MSWCYYDVDEPIPKEAQTYTLPSKKLALKRNGFIETMHDVEAKCDDISQYYYQANIQCKRYDILGRGCFLPNVGIYRTKLP